MKRAEATSMVAAGCNCHFCFHNQNVATPAIAAAPQRSRPVGPWDWKPVCAAHLSGWWDGSDNPQGKDAPPFMVRADALREGDAVDLEGDEYADPNQDHPGFEFELVEVCEVELETPTCVAIGFEGFDIVGFPPNHMLKLHRRAEVESAS